ncbi:phage integrase Arm DNA-binding domain-containing protein [Escherichia coli O157:H7]|nr:phage integrase Arm DNA-binding domain-containing protein [Escherichia coli O157:H7]MBY4930164.1 phage integrase Arm DNA-binding domain-containing protein [Escherichia coli O157:H7]
MGRRRSHERRDLPPNLYIRNNITATGTQGRVKSLV